MVSKLTLISMGAIFAGLFASLPNAVAQPCPDYLDGPEVVFRDSIGPGNSTTNGNQALGIWRLLGTYGQVPISIVAPVDVILKEVRVISCQMSYNPQYEFGSLIDYWLVRGWNSWSQFYSGGVPALETTFESPTLGPTLFGETGFIPGAGPKPTYELTFDLTNQDETVLQGETFVLTVGCQLIYVDEDQPIYGIVETTEIGPSDVFCSQSIPPPSNCAIAHQVLQTQYSGRMAYTVTGNIRHLRGDMNNDGLRSAVDVSAFCDALLEPTSFESMHPGVPLLAADMNCDGLVDGLDVAPLAASITVP